MTERNSVNALPDRKVGDHDREKLGERPARQQVVDDDGLAGTRVNGGNRDVRHQPRQNPDREQQRDKQNRRIRQFVADTLDRGQHAGSEACFCLFF